MDHDLEDLFGVLDQQTRVGRVGPEESVEIGPQDAELLDLQDPKEFETQRQFEKIDKKLRSLPKLQNSFDALAGKQRELPEQRKLRSAASADVLLKEQQQQQQAAAAAATGSDDWFTLPKPDRATRDRAQRDLLLLKHRAALDPKRHYKKDKWQVPERFAVGTLVEDNSEFYSSRLTNRQRKSTMLETLMGDQDTARYFKRKYSQIQQQRTSGRKAHYRSTKAIRRQKK